MTAPAKALNNVGLRAARSFGAWVLLAFVRAYQVLLSHFLGGACKFYPSCSNYAYEAIARHGARRGSILAMKRLLRCRPFTKGGVDLVPEVLEVHDKNLHKVLSSDSGHALAAKESR